ncbi:hypothetical protein Leryth_002931 [Lithospermum erythrorhizon]|nr:hypothetical protein Leryth_002931 [Lithospermum erythrorhizon]
MMTTAAASTGIGLTSPWNPTKLINNFDKQRPKWMNLPNQSSSSSRVTKMAASVDEKLKTFTLQKSEEAFNKAKELMPGGVNSPVRAFKSSMETAYCN